MQLRIASRLHDKPSGAIKHAFCIFCFLLALLHVLSLRLSQGQLSGALHRASGTSKLFPPLRFGGPAFNYALGFPVLRDVNTLFVFFLSFTAFRRNTNLYRHWLLGLKNGVGCVWASGPASEPVGSQVLPEALEEFHRTRDLKGQCDHDSSGET